MTGSKWSDVGALFDSVGGIFIPPAAADTKLTFRGKTGPAKDPISSNENGERRIPFHYSFFFFTRISQSMLPVPMIRSVELLL